MKGGILDCGVTGPVVTALHHMVLLVFPADMLAILVLVTGHNI